VARLLDEIGLGAERRLQLRKYSKGMIQRVGLAQALVNDPEVVFLDEPMSGLDPLGRRQVRDLILRLRDRGTTVFFSSHILSDAEAICSRVGILAGGRLVAAGPVAEMVPFQIRGWELTATNVSDAVTRSLSDLGVSSTMVSADRHHMRLPVSASPEQVVSRISAAGGQVLSLTPVRDTLEDFFVEQVRRTAPRDFDPPGPRTD
jgi:ABC-2 type transport system ATP-binding protein